MKIFLIHFLVWKDAGGDNHYNHNGRLSSLFSLKKRLSVQLTLFDPQQSLEGIEVDEFALSDDDLHPQKSKNYDAGLHLKMGVAAEISLTLFQMITTNEIYYGEDPVTRA
ncbi:MAG: TonB-dependent receptor [Desulfobacteraceae bacterium]|nr:TonB-dependent receptor [Desulfobacteraceae bacterium]